MKSISYINFAGNDNLAMMCQVYGDSLVHFLLYFLYKIFADISDIQYINWFCLFAFENYFCLIALLSSEFA